MASVPISLLDPAGEITGDELLELVQSGGSVRSTVNAIKNGGVKVYRALIGQSGTNAPTATVLENSLGGTVVWSRFSPGVYIATLNGAFAANKTLATISSVSDVPGLIWISDIQPDSVSITSGDLTGSAGDDNIGGGFVALTILVYP